MDRFTKAYIETALWASNDDNDKPMDANYKIKNLHPDTLTRMTADCQNFQQDNADLLEKAYKAIGREDAEELAGHDFWLTRNHHGAGFWDGDWEDYGDKLTEVCHGWPEINLYVGDDKKIYL